MVHNANNPSIMWSTAACTWTWLLLKKEREREIITKVSPQRIPYLKICILYPRQTRFQHSDSNSGWRTSNFVFICICWSIASFCGIPVNEWGVPAVSYKLAGWFWEIMNEIEMFRKGFRKEIKVFGNGPIRRRRKCRHLGKLPWSIHGKLLIKRHFSRRATDRTYTF